MKKGINKKGAISIMSAAIIAGTSIPIYAQSSYIKKDETVYSILSPDGSAQKNIVSEWISGDDSLDEINDKSILKGIKNVKGDEKPDIDGENVKWNTNKEDLYYQGNTDKKLPISADIEYTLDGKEVKPEDIEGQSGKIKMTIRLSNHEQRSVTINGKERTVYVPFVTATEVILPRHNFKKVKASSGKLLDDGKNSSITAISSPGLKSSIDPNGNLGSLFNEISSTIVIEAEAKNFESPEIMIAATSEIPDLGDIDESADMGDLKAMIDKFKAAGDELIKGTEALYKGSSELSSNYEKFDKGVGTLGEGIKKLTDGITLMGQNVPKLNKGAEDLMNGIQRLSDGQDKLSTGVSMYVENTENLYNAYSDIDNGIKSAKAGADRLYDAIPEGSSAGVGQLESSADANQGIAGSIEGEAQAILGDENASEESKAAAQQIIALAKQSAGISVKQKEGLGRISSASGSISELKSAVSQLSSGLGDLSSGSEQFKGEFSKLVEAGGNLEENSSKINGATGELYTGSQQIYGGTAQLQSGTNELTAGGSQLQAGSSELAGNSKKILSGTKELASGAGKLNEGVKSAKSEVENELSGKTGKIEEIKDIIDAKDVLEDLSKEYDNFAGKGEDMNGSVKFIMKVESTEKEDNGTEEKKVEEEKTGIKWLIDNIRK